MKVINGCLVCNKDDSHIAVDAMVSQLMEFVNALNPKMKEMVENDPNCKKRALATATRIKDLVDGLRSVKNSTDGWPKKCVFSCPKFVSEESWNFVWRKSPEEILTVLINRQLS